MKYPAYYYFSYAAHLMLWGHILYRCRRERSARRFLLFYTYVGLSIVSMTLKMVVPYFVELSSWSYYAFYFASNVPLLVVQTALLLFIYSLVPKANRWGHLVAIGASLTLCTWQTLLSPAADIYFRITSSVLFFQLALCTLTAWRLVTNRAFTLGRNWEAIFLGISVPNVFHALNSAAFLFEDWWPYPLYLRLIEPLSLLSWVIMAAGMRKIYLSQLSVRVQPEAAREVEACSG